MPSIFDLDADEIGTSVIVDRICDAINAIPEAERVAKKCAETTYETLKAVAVEMGMNETEVLFREPNDPRCYFKNGNSYVVAFESGPYQWAIPASMAIGTRCGKLVEPYYSFDLCFYPAED